MNVLPTQFTKKGFRHEQLVREGNVAIYRRQKEGSSQEHFEVVKIRSHNGFERELPDGSKMVAAPGEIYPSAEKWGTDGWTCLSETASRERLQKVLSCISVNRSAAFDTVFDHPATPEGLGGASSAV